MKEILPPKWAVYLLERFLEPDLFQGVYGDLLEDFNQNVKRFGAQRAKLKFIREVAGYIRYPYLLKRPIFHLNPFNAPTMLGHYLKISLRNFYKRKGFSIINMLGLSFGVLVCILMAFYIEDELTYDQFHKKGDRLHRITISYKSENKDGLASKMTFPAKAILLEEYPEVEKVIRFYSNTALNNIPLLRSGEKSYTEEKFLFSDPEIFDAFDFRLLKGDPTRVLEAHQNVLLTESTALKYFGNEDPIGKTFRYQNETDLTVTGIVEDLPGNSHIQFDFLAPINLQRYKWMGGKGGTGYDLEQDWNWAGCWLFVLLKEGADPEVFEEKVQAIAKKYFDEPGKISYALHLQSLPNLHFNAFPTSEMSAGGNRTQVYGLFIIGLLILIIAGINYMNLATARASERGKEVGIRKVLGARRGQLISQFLGEALLLSVMAVLIAGLSAELLAPYFNDFTNKQLNIQFFGNPTNLFILLVSACLIGFLSGIYPAFFLSRFKPVKTLKNIFTTPNASGISVRKTLVVFQFTISTALIIGVMILWQQLDYLRNKDLGFQKENVMLVKNGWAVSKKLEVLKNRLESETGIDKIYQGYVPGQPAFYNTFEVEGKTEATRMAVRHVGFDFFDMFNIPILEGRAFSTGLSQDSTQSVILNEAALSHLNWTPAEALSKSLIFTAGADNQTKMNLRVVGIAKNANFEALHHSLDPVVFKVGTFGDVAIRLKPGQMAASVRKVQDTWKSIIPDWPLEYSFLDETLAQKYLKEEKLQAMIQYFAFLAIFIALIGLIGLVSLTIHQRYKEIGIRKVLGASASNIIQLLSWDFLKLVLIAIIIAIPIAAYLMQEWLQDFAYRIHLNFWVFLLAGLTSILLTLLIVGWQTLRVAMHNPAESLKTE